VSNSTIVLTPFGTPFCCEVTNNNNSVIMADKRQTSASPSAPAAQTPASPKTSSEPSAASTPAQTQAQAFQKLEPCKFFVFSIS
jgi:hypothetical protein